METEVTSRGPGRPPKPKLVRVRLRHGYVPSVFPEDRQPVGDILPKAAAGSVIDLPEDEARALVKAQKAELVFDGEDLDWMTEPEKRAREDAEERRRLKERLAMLYAQKMAEVGR